MTTWNQLPPVVAEGDPNHTAHHNLLRNAAEQLQTEVDAIAAGGGGGGTGDVTQAELDAAVAPKADKTYVDAQDSALSDDIDGNTAAIGILQTALNNKSDVSYVDAADTALQTGKADKTYVDAADAALQAGKADKTYVDAQDAALDSRIDALEAEPATPATVYTSDTEPTGGTYKVGDLWVSDPGGGAALVFRGIWTGTDWGEPSAYPVDVTYTSDPGRPESVIRNDYVAAPANRDTYQVWSNGELTWWVNEWGGLRIRVAENSAWDNPLRLIGATNQSGDYMEAVDSTRQVQLMRIKANGSIVAPNVQDPVVIAYGSDPIPNQAQRPCLVGRVGGTTTRYDFFDGPANGTAASGANGWDSVVGEPPVYSSAAAYAGHLNGLVSNLNGGLSSYVVKKFPNGGYLNAGYARMRVRLPALGDRNARVFSTEATTGGHRHPIRINTSGKVEITSYDGTTVLATSTTTLATGTWYDLGIKWNRGTTTANGSCEVRIYTSVGGDTAAETVTVSAGNFFGAGGDIWALRWGLQATNAGTNMLHIAMVAWSPYDWPTSAPPEGTAALFLHDGTTEIPIAGGGGGGGTADWVNPSTAVTELTDPTAQRVMGFDVHDDGSDTQQWPDRLQFRFESAPNSGTFVRTGGFNEYGELRAEPAKVNTVAARVHGHASGSTGPIFQVRNVRGGSVDMLAVSTSAVTCQVPLSAPNMTGILSLAVGAPVPVGTPVGTVIVRY